MLQLETPQSLAVSVPPTSPQTQPPKSSPSSSCPVSGAAARPTGGSCPFATVMPSSRLPVLRTESDGTVVAVPRQCPRWVRVLRFSARLVAKQVIIRTAKMTIINLVKRIRPRSDDAASDVSTVSQ